MVKKTQLRKYTIDRIMQIVNSETNGEDLKVYKQFIDDKNVVMRQKRQQLLEQIESARRSIQKAIRQMNEGIKDRIQLKSKIAMTKNSRPSKEDIKELADLFEYMEKQTNFTYRNSNDIQNYQNCLIKINDRLRNQTTLRIDSSDLDEKYYQLNQQCAKEQLVRQQLIKQRDANRKHYNSISTSIQQCRIQYELVQQNIRQKQRELIQLTSYLETRQLEDRQALNELRKDTMAIEDKLLTSQTVLNCNQSKCQQFFIKEIQIVDHQNIR